MWWKKSPDPFKKIKIEYCPHSLSLLYIKVEEYQNILKLRWWSLALTSYKAFLKNKKRCGTSLPISFLIFEKKMFLKLYSINWSNFTVWLLLFYEKLGTVMFIAIVCFAVCDVTNFEIYLSFLIRPIHKMTKKLRSKI